MLKNTLLVNNIYSVNQYVKRIFNLFSRELAPVHIDYRIVIDFSGYVH